MSGDMPQWQNVLMSNTTTDDALTPAEAEAFRVQVREFLEKNASGIGRRSDTSVQIAKTYQSALVEAGLAGLVYGKEHGGAGLTRAHDRIYREEYGKYPDMTFELTISHGMCLPVLNQFGTEEHKREFMPDLIAARTMWCQMFSEPGAGSDVASLQTRAELDGDEWVLNGQKVWTTLAHVSDYGVLIARTNPDAPKHAGISMFIVDMKAPGMEIRPIHQIDGGSHFNEVFFTDVRIPHANVVGDVNDGWRLAKVTLGNERVSLSTGGVLWGNGPTALDVIAEAKKLGITNRTMRHRLVDIYIEHTILEIIRMRTLTARLRGTQPGPEASIRKIMADEHGQTVMELARDITGAQAMVIGQEDAVAGKSITSKSWYSGYMFSKALTIGGGTGEVQRNILGERVLKLPSEPNPQSGQAWSQSTSQK